MSVFEEVTVIRGFIVRDFFKKFKLFMASLKIYVISRRNKQLVTCYNILVAQH